MLEMVGMNLDLEADFTKGVWDYHPAERPVYKERKRLKPLFGCLLRIGWLLRLGPT